MLARRTTSTGIVYYISPLLERIGVPHAFSTRIGGTSPPPFDSFNLGNPSGCEEQDDYARIYHHFDLLQSAVGCGERKRAWVHQVHGGMVIPIRHGQPFENGPKADGTATDDPTRLLSVRVADCVPVLISSHDGRFVAAVHAGWRGVIANVAAYAVGLIAEMGGTDCVAAIGPCIGVDAFEVGPEVLGQFQRHLGNDAPIRRRKDGKGHVDLREAIRFELRHKGIAAEDIDTTDRCTFRDADEFFSHRRDKGVTGRMAAIISPVAS